MNKPLRNVPHSPRLKLGQNEGLGRNKLKVSSPQYSPRIRPSLSLKKSKDGTSKAPQLFYVPNANIYSVLQSLSKYSNQKVQIVH